VDPSRFTSLVVKLWGYKAGVVAPALPTSSHTISHRSYAYFPMAEKKKIGKQIWKDKKGVVELMGSRHAFPFVPWWS
jgi:hypothetical protein